MSSSDPEPRHYYLTDAAYNHLIILAQKHHYVLWGTSRAKGLSTFLNNLSAYPLIDTRPDIIIDRHKQEAKYNRAPTWTNSRLRRSRSLKLTDDAIQNYCTYALLHGIVQETPFAVGGPKRLSPLPTVSAVLEAIGLGWLTPEFIPTLEKVIPLEG